MQNQNLATLAHLLTVALVCLSTERYHCLSMDGRCLAISMNAELDSCSMEGQRLTENKINVGLVNLIITIKDT